MSRIETIGNATLYLCDCLEVMAGLPDASVDMILCDLPYGTTACKWDTVIPFEPLWAQYRRVAKRNAAIVLFAQTPFDKVLGASNLPMLRYEWLWKKQQGSGSLNANKMPLKIIENALVFYQALPTYSPQKTAGKPYKVTRSKAKSEILGKTGTSDGFVSENAGERFPTNLIEFPYEFMYGDKLHPTQKPVALMEYMIRTYTRDGETVLDNCMGSGTTGVACARLGRSFVGIERESRYFEIACRRIEDAQRQGRGTA